MALVPGSFPDPALEERELGGSQRVSGLLGGHMRRISQGKADALGERTGQDIARDHCPIGLVEAQVSRAFVLVLTMAAKTVRREDRANLLSIP